MPLIASLRALNPGPCCSGSLLAPVVLRRWCSGSKVLLTLLWPGLAGRG
jgi:hypothetical protein